MCAHLALLLGVKVVDKGAKGSRGSLTWRFVVFLVSLFARAFCARSLVFACTAHHLTMGDSMNETSFSFLFIPALQYFLDSHHHLSITDRALNQTYGRDINGHQIASTAEAR